MLPLAGVIQVSTSPGPFNIWNIIIGMPLVLVLAVFSRSHSLGFVERMALASIWGFALMSAGGYFLQALYPTLRGLRPAFDIRALTGKQLAAIIWLGWWYIQ